nr:flippase [Escherichia coli]
ILHISAILLFLSLIFSFFVFVFSDKIIFFVFGIEYERAIPLIKTIIWVIPLRSWVLSLTILWFIPINKEKFITKITLVNIMLISFTACLFIYLFGTIGIVMSILLSEIITFVILTYFFFKEN